jgi:hypothetical protein
MSLVAHYGLTEPRHRRTAGRGWGPDRTPSAYPARIDVMALNVQAVLDEIDEVFARCGASAETPFVAKNSPTPGFFGDPGVRGGNAAAMVSALVAAITRNAPHPSYVSSAHEYAGGGKATSAVVDRLLGVLLSVRTDIERGYVRTLEQRARDEVFDDLLQTASSIANSSAAAAIVLAVSVLEEHVRKLASGHGLATVTTKGRHRSFEDMTADLLTSGQLTSSEKRLIGGWYGQRTEAAHGHFESVLDEEAPRIIDGVRDFLVRHPG